MDGVIIDYQKGTLNKEEVFFKLKKYLVSQNSIDVLVNIIAYILKDYNLREQSIHNVFKLFFEFGLNCEKNETNYIMNFTNTIIEKLLLIGLNVKDLKIRVNCLIGINIILEIIKLENSLELKLDKNYLAKCLFQISLKDKSSIAKSIAISNLGLLLEGKHYLLEIMTNSQNYIDRIRSLNSISIENMDELDIMNYFSRMLDENAKVRKLFYKTLYKNVETFIKLMPSCISWSHFMIICQFGLNDRNIVVRNSCINFLIEFISIKYEQDSFNGKIFVSLIDDMLDSLLNKDYIDITTSNIEAMTELLLPNLLNYLNYNIDAFLEEIINLTNRKSMIQDSEIFLNLKFSQILVIRIVFENNRNLFDLEKYQYFNIENMIFYLSINSNNSFLIRQILLVVDCLDKSDPEIRKMIESLTINCLKYTPFEDSLELLESELVPFESMIRSSNGGEWVAYFLHRSVIWTSIKLLEKCVEMDKFLVIIYSVINEIMNPDEEDEKLSEAQLKIHKMKDLMEYLNLKDDFNKENLSSSCHIIEEIIETRWMRILFILEASLSVIDVIKDEDIIYFTEDILKPCTYFFVKYSQDHEIPQILLARCTALITIMQERSRLSNHPINKRNDNLSFFIKGLENALKELDFKTENFEISNDNTLLYTAIQCEVYVCSIIDIFMIRKMKNEDYEIDSDLLCGLNNIWKLANGSNISTYRLSSISIRGISRILLCLKTDDNYMSTSINMLTCLLYLTYFTETFNEFNVLTQPQEFSNLNNTENFKEKIRHISDIFSIEDLLKIKQKKLTISSGDKQMLIYLFSTYMTLSLRHFKYFTISIYKTIEAICETIGTLTWTSYSKDVNKLLLFGILQLKQASEYFDNYEINSIKSYSNLYGLISLFLMSIKFPKYMKKIDLKKRISQLLSYLILELKYSNQECIEWAIIIHLLKNADFSKFVDENILKNYHEHIKNIKSDNSVIFSIRDNEFKKLYLDLLKTKKINLPKIETLIIDENKN